MDDGAVSVPRKASDKRRSRRSDTVRTTALHALGRVLEPLAGFVLETGLSVQEAQAVLRSAAVHSAAKRQRETQQRVSISGIAASTGISRAEVSRILRAPAPASVAVSERRQQATNRILAAWQDDPKFMKPNGQPATLKVYGEGASFDALVKAHGRGLPTRAMLDELVRANAVTLMSAQRVRIKVLTKAKGGVSAQSVKLFGERAEQVLATMLEILRDPESLQFVTSVEGPIESGSLPLLRREISSGAADYLARIRENLFSEDYGENNRKSERSPKSVSLTVVFREDKFANFSKQSSAVARRNLRRAIS
jgi:hypothetical protein